MSATTNSYLDYQDNVHAKRIKELEEKIMTHDCDRQDFNFCSCRPWARELVQLNRSKLGGDHV